MTSVLSAACQTSTVARKAPRPWNIPVVQAPGEMHGEIHGELTQLTTQQLQTQALPTEPQETANAAPVPQTVAPAPAADVAGTATAASTASVSSSVSASVPPPPLMLAKRGALPPVTPDEPLKRLKSFEFSRLELSKPNETPLIFDIPVTYNERVRQWVRYFQTEGRVTFKNWLERSARFLPVLQFELSRAGLPQDLVYVAMVESGFVSSAVSHAGAMGMWQFIGPTATRYGLRIDWWIDERKDFLKATRAAIRYMTDLYQQFSSWYLVAASYNMGENGVRRLIQRHGTRNFWELADRGVLPQETRDYVPKIIAAMLISKAPALYGFRELEYQMPLSYESVNVPGGTDIVNLASYLGVSERYLRDLNPELLKGFVPAGVRGHSIRVPKGSMYEVSQYIRLQARNDDGISAAN